MGNLYVRRRGRGVRGVRQGAARGHAVGACRDTAMLQRGGMHVSRARGESRPRTTAPRAGEGWEHASGPDVTHSPTRLARSTLHPLSTLKLAGRYRRPDRASSECCVPRSETPYSQCSRHRYTTQHPAAMAYPNSRTDELCDVESGGAPLQPGRGGGPRTLPDTEPCAAVKAESPRSQVFSRVRYWP